MAEQNPDLIPLPSIGESTSSRTPAPATMPRRRSWMGIVVTLCVVVGVGLGVYVYQQSIAPAPTPSLRPTPIPQPTLEPSPSPEVPNINAVSQQSNTITFPKAGEVRVFFATYDSQSPVITNQLIRLTTSNGSSDLVVPATVPAGDRMADMRSHLVVSAGQQVTIGVFDHGNETRPGIGWIKPTATNLCGQPGRESNASALVAWATAESLGEPLVSVQCWGDWGTEEDTDYNDYIVILSYMPPGTTTSPSPSPSQSLSPSPSPSRSPSPSPSRSPSPTPSTQSSPSSSSLTQSTPTPSPRVTMPEASALPDAGVFEVTIGTMGFGLVLVLLGILGILMI